MQIFDVDTDYPVLALDATNDTLRINDFAGDKCGMHCPSIPLDDYSGRTALHLVEIKFGPSGWLDYTILDAITGEKILLYHGDGIMGGNSS
jgi:hypothetical protein